MTAGTSSFRTCRVGSLPRLTVNLDPKIHIYRNSPKKNNEITKAKDVCSIFLQNSSGIKMEQ